MKTAEAIASSSTAGTVEIGRKGSGDDKLFASLSNDDDDDEEPEDPLAWVPKKIVSEWTNEDGIKCISIIFQLSGGNPLKNNDDVEVQVSTLGDEVAASEV
jgi:hypothetical protein